MAWMVDTDQWRPALSGCSSFSAAITRSSAATTEDPLGRTKPGWCSQYGWRSYWPWLSFLY
ncbi:hypothetical protein [Synechococcus sp. MIT S9509]|uniref:hypothetical protein n=1 Tax=Synechococcus sp. MIT S9509 TaxID=1801630 RepID=UPI00082EC3E6|nr:hypothetical protein [Synechococcus sp. MIT S9509]